MDEEEQYEDSSKNEEVSVIDNEFNLNYLSAKKDGDFPYYFNALDKAIEDADAENIALTGAYGSGKSTVIESYINNKEDGFKNEVLKISLANFNEEVKLDKKDKVLLEKEIETHILKQLFYQIDINTIKQSRFKRIQDVSVKYKKWMSFAYSVWIFSIIYLLYNKPFSLAHDFNNFIVWWNFIVNLVFVIGLYCTIKFVIDLIKQGKITKLSYKSNSVELNSKSVLSKHLNEIVYFFTQTSAKVLFIEDLDRFNDVGIFTKLRELNSILNNTPEIKQNITFVYATRDDVFKNNTERTKFFDLIIPIIPVINASNSEGKLIKIIKESNLDEQIKNKLDEQFIFDISLYIYDMRLLFNIFNEFLFYNKIVNKDQNLSIKKIFSIVIFKNVFPDEFNNLHQEKGLLHYIFKEGKNSLIQDILSDIYSVIEEASKTPDEIVENDEIMSNKIFSNDKLKKQLPFLKLTAILKEVKSRFDKDEALNGLFDSYYSEIYKTSTNNLKVDKHYWNLLFYLIQKEYLDENYQMYLSHFHEGALTKNDQKFLALLKSNQALDNSFNLNKPENIIPRLYLQDYKNIGILNYYLFNYIFKNNKKEEIKLLKKHFKTENDYAIKFAFDFIEYLRINKEDYTLKLFIQNLVSEWKEIWNYIEENNTYNDEDKKQFLVLLLNSISEHFLIRKVDDLSKNRLSKYVLSLNDFLSLFSNKKTGERLKELSIKFNNIDIDATKDNTLLDFIYENNMYEINHIMLLNIMLYKLRGQNPEELLRRFKTNNYSFVKKSGLSVLTNYIEQNLKKYVNNVYLDLEEQKESQDTLLDIVNSDIAIDLIQKILLKNKHNIFDYSEIENKDIIDFLFENEKIKADWYNIYYYFNDEGDTLTEIIIDYLNKETVYRKLSKYNIESVLVGVDTSDFCEAIIYSSDISEKAFESLFRGMTLSYIITIDLSKVDSERIGFLIHNTSKVYSIDNYNYLKENYSKYHISLIQNNLDSFIDYEGDMACFKDLDVEENDYLTLLESENISEKQKEEIIEIINEEYLINNELLSAVLNILYKTTDKELLKNQRERILNNINDKQEKVKFCTKLLSELKFIGSRSCIRELPYPFSKIVTGGNLPHFDNNKVNRKFLEQMKEMNYISTFEQKGEKIIVKKH